MRHFRYVDILNFQKCPLLVKKFLIQEEDKFKTQVNNCVINIFQTELETKAIPDYAKLYKKINTYLSSKPLKFSDSFAGLFNLYKLEILIQGFSTLSTNIAFAYGKSGKVYEAIIPVLIANKKREIYPLFIIWNSRIKRDNEIRFASFLMAQQLEYSPTKYFIIFINQNKDKSLEFDLVNYNYNKDELARAQKEFVDIYKLFNSDYCVPNMNYCKTCNKTSECLL